MFTAIILKLYIDYRRGPNLYKYICKVIFSKLGYILNTPTHI